MKRILAFTAFGLCACEPIVQVSEAEITGIDTEAIGYMVDCTETDPDTGKVTRYFFTGDQLYHVQGTNMRALCDMVNPDLETIKNMNGLKNRPSYCQQFDHAFLVSLRWDENNTWNGHHWATYDSELDASGLRLIYENGTIERAAGGEWDEKYDRPIPDMRTDTCEFTDKGTVRELIK